MLLLPIPHPGGLIDLLIVLEDENLVRIKEHDNAEVHWQQLPTKGMTLRTIGIAYANPEEAKKIYEWAEEGKVQECVQLLLKQSREGFRYRPELGDHDYGPMTIKGKKSS